MRAHGVLERNTAGLTGFRRTTRSAAILITGLMVVPEAQGQLGLAASEFATVSQFVDGTELSMRYFRPRARGRRGLFGTQVKFGETWTPGANLATVLRVSKDVTIESVPVPQGSYSMWFQVERGPWELVLDRDTTLFHTQMPRPRPGQVRIPVQRETRPFMEVLSWWFADVRNDGTTLVMHWDTVAVPLRVGVTPSFSRAVAPEVARPIVGRYRVRWEPLPDSLTRRRDSTIHEVDDQPGEHTLTVRYESGELRATMDPPMYRTEAGYTDWIIIPTRPNWFTLGRLLNGELVEVGMGMQMRFDVSGGTARSFEVRAPDDSLVGSGTRISPGSSR